MNINEYVEKGKELLSNIKQYNEDYAFDINKKSGRVILYNDIIAHLFYMITNNIKHFQITYNKEDAFSVKRFLLLPYVNGFNLTKDEDTRLKKLFVNEISKNNINEIETKEIDNYKYVINNKLLKMYFETKENDNFIYVLMYKDNNDIKYFSFKCDKDAWSGVNSFLLPEWIESVI